MPIVQMPDGAHVQFPDNMPPDQIRSLILQKFPDAAKSGGTLASAPKGSIFDFTSPEGKEYTVNGPAGSTPEQAFAILQQHLGQQPSGGKLGTTFDAEGARKAGYTDAEIQGVQKALAAGYTPQEIGDHLSQGSSPRRPATLTIFNPSPELSRLPPRKDISTTWCPRATCSTNRRPRSRRGTCLISPLSALVAFWPMPPTL
jgi:hypothetical protein